MNLTHEERIVAAIFNTGNREITITHMSEMLPDLDDEGAELRELTESVIKKLSAMTDAEYESLDLVIDF